MTPFNKASTPEEKLLSLYRDGYYNQLSEAAEWKRKYEELLLTYNSLLSEFRDLKIESEIAHSLLEDLTKLVERRNRKAQGYLD